MARTRLDTNSETYKARLKLSTQIKALAPTFSQQLRTLWALQNKYSLTQVNLFCSGARVPPILEGENLIKAMEKNQKLSQKV